MRQTLTPNFLVKQVKIINTSSYGIYINLSPSIPTTLKFDYYVAPNSNLITPAISVNAITFFAPSFAPLASVPEISLYDTADLSPFSSPFDYYQYVGFPKYPFSFTITSSTFNEITTLPDVTINKYQNVFFTLSPDPNVALELQTGLILYAFIGGARIDIGAFPPAGGIVYYIPRGLPETLPLRAFSSGKISSNFTYTLNVFQSEQPLFADYSGFASPITIPFGQTGSLIHASTPPGFMWSIKAQDIGAGSHTARIFMQVLHEIPITGLYYTLLDNLITVDPTLNGSFIIRPRIQMLPFPALVKINWTNQAGANSDIIMIQAKNL